MDRRNFLAGGLALMATAPQRALPGFHWTLLGTRRVSATFGRVSIPVFRARNPITALSFRTRGDEVRISDVRVIFARGGSERILSLVTARASVHSMPLMLRSRNRDIRSVEFTYRRVRPTNRSTTTIELHGRR